MTSSSQHPTSADVIEQNTTGSRNMALTLGIGAGVFAFLAITFARDHGILGDEATELAVANARIAELETALKEKELEIARLHRELESRNHEPTWNGSPLTNRSAINKVERAALARRDFFELKGKVELAESNLRDLTNEVDVWNAAKEECESEETGKRIAASDKLVRQFVNLQYEERISNTEVTTLKSKLAALSAVLDDESIDVGAGLVPGPEFSEALAAINSEITFGLESIRNHNSIIQSVISRAANITPAEITLAESIRSIEEADAQQRAQAIEVARKTAFDTATVEQAEAEKRLVAVEERIKTQRIQLHAELAEQKAEGLKQAMADAIEAAILAREKERLRKEALQQKVLTVLAPLTTPDYSQPYQILGTGADGKRTHQKQPVSFSKIKSLGVLDQTQEGLKKLALLNSTNWTRRPRWNMAYEAPSPSLWSDSQQDLIVLTQEYLIKYGEILAEEGILAP